VDESCKEQLTTELLEKHSCLPVFLSNEVADLHYNGFSNG
jgi:trehalose-6-phosphate synthase